MNNYPSWWNTTITLFNRFEDPITQLVTWYKTEITGCFWRDEHVKLKINDVIVEGDRIICRIRKDNRFIDIEPWLNLTADEKEHYFTFSYHDIIIKGQVDDVINEYRSGYRSTDLVSKYKKLQRCLEIEKFVDNTGGERGNEHYLLTGI